MDLDDSSPDEKEFPGLYERNASKGKKGTGDENESNSSENVHLTKKSSEKLKADKKAKDRQSYEALGGESEEDNTETKLFRSPSKSKKSKAFKFPSTKKEKREKSIEAKDSIDKKVKEDSKADKKKAKKEKKSKSNSLTSEVLEIGGAQINFD